MWAEDRASPGLGMTIVAVGPGTATLTMPIRPDMVNGHGIAHGGFTYALADSAFAFACNSFNRRAVAQTNAITYLRPARLGDVLTATATRTAEAGRSGIYDVIVRDGDGRDIATLRGQSRIIEGTLIP
jgi:acyl-CoA thioesterase